jgi:effector-binding domain-containing protein
MERFEIVDIPGQTVAMIRRDVPMAELPAFFEDAFGRVAGAIGAAGAQIAGAPFGWYFGVPGETVDVAAGFPLSGSVPVGAPEEVVVKERPGGRAVVAMHIGPYETMASTYTQLQTWMADRALSPRRDMWEEYLSPPEGDPSTWQTRIVMPLM